MALQVVGRHRILKGETVDIAWVSSIDVTLYYAVRIIYDDGQTDTLRQDPFATGVVTAVTKAFGQRHAKQNGWIVDAQINAATVGQRGQTMVALTIADAPDGMMICAGYIYAFHPVVMDQFDEAGPGGGEGSLSWVSLAADIAPVDVTQVLAATSAFRRIWGFVWYYNAAAVVATRTMTARLRKPGLAFPTGFALTGGVWNSASISLTTGEEGIMYVKGQGAAYAVNNDADTLSVANTTTAPLPFPYDALKDDLADLLFDIDAADAADRHSIYLLQEEWVKL